MTEPNKPKSIPQQLETLTNLLAETKADYGWDGVAHIVEGAMLRLGLDDWAAKAPGSVGRLKRLRQAIAPPE